MANSAKQTKTETVAGYTFLICPDSGILLNHLNSLNLDQKRSIYWGDEELPPSFWNSIDSGGLLGTLQTIVVRRANNFSEAIWKRVNSSLRRQTCCIYFCLEGAWEKGNPKFTNFFKNLPCFQLATKNGWIWQQPGLNEKNIQAYIKKLCQQKQMVFANEVLEQFCLGLPLDANAIENELAKFAIGLEIEAENNTANGMKNNRIDAKLLPLASWVPKSNIFACLQHLEAGRILPATVEMERSRQDAEGLLFPLLHLLQRDLRLLWQIFLGESVNTWDIGKKQAFARKLGLPKIAQLMQLVVDIEYKIKSGLANSEQCLEALFAEVALICKN